MKIILLLFFMQLQQSYNRSAGGLDTGNCCNTDTVNVVCSCCCCFVCSYSAMAERVPSGASAADCGDVVKIPKSQYQQAVAVMKQQKYQLVAASNLHRLMREKEEELAASKEENKQLHLALQQNESRMSNIIRLQAATAATTSLNAATHSLEEDCANVCTSTNHDRFLHLQSDVVPDGDGELVTEKRQFPVLPSSISKSTEKHASKSVTLESAPVPVPVTLLPTVSVTLPSADVSSPSTDTCATRVTCSTSSVPVRMSSVSSVSSVTNPESKDLLDKVLQQNARLKKTLRDLLSQKGLSVSTYLVCHCVVKN